MSEESFYVCYGCDMGCCSECDSSSGCECKKARHRLFYCDRGVQRMRTKEELILLALADAVDGR